MVVYFSFQVKIGKNVATTKEQNSKDWETNIGKKSIGNIIPTKIDFEKSGLGKKRIPPTKPTIIETYAFFSLNCLE